jgi:hypothetical protein
MAAKRLGSALGNVQGTSNQLLRVKTDESGFEFVNPASIPSYTLSNITTDRIIDGTTTTIDEIARVLGTLIQDLTDAGLTGAGGISAFTWSTSEQVWPFEKHDDGSTLYCRYVDFGALPNSGTKTVAHNISGLTADKMAAFRFNVKSSSYVSFYSMDGGSGWSGHGVGARIDPADNIVCNTSSSFFSSNSFTGRAYIIYSK